MQLAGTAACFLCFQSTLVLEEAAGLRKKKSFWEEAWTLDKKTQNLLVHRWSDCGVRVGQIFKLFPSFPKGCCKMVSLGKKKKAQFYKCGSMPAQNMTVNVKRRILRWFNKLARIILIGAAPHVLCNQGQCLKLITLLLVLFWTISQYLYNLSSLCLCSSSCFISIGKMPSFSTSHIGIWYLVRANFGLGVCSMFRWHVSGT